MSYVRTPEHREKMSKSLKDSSVFQAAVHSEEYRRMKKQEALLRREKPPIFFGDKSSNWKGGLTTLSNGIRSLMEFRQWRSDVYTRDNFTCQDCGATKVYLECHHIKSFKKIILDNKITNTVEALACAELWNINNGKTLCKDCHKKTDNYGGKNFKLLPSLKGHKNVST